jgi:O-antigen ligase
MRKVTLLVLWLFICSVPWGIDWTLLEIGTITRLIGIIAIGAGLLATASEGRIRRPDAIVWCAVAFAGVSFLSLLWSISGYTAERVGTYIQFAALVWLVREFAPARRDQDALRLAFCIGGLIFVFELLRNYGIGLHVQDNAGRYTATGINPNFVGFVLVTGLPMAWHLFLNHRGAVRVVSSLYCLVAPVTVVLTGSRSAFLALLVAASVIPFTVRPRSSSFWLRVAVMCFGAIVTVGLVVPRQTWDRLLTITQELRGGTMSGRTPVWEAAVSLIEERPLLGAGVGAFPTATAPLFDGEKAAHNVALALLVEQGVVGLLLFAGLLAACAWVTKGLPPPERQLWAASIIAWFIFAMSHDAHNDRVTWVMFALLAARHGAGEYEQLTRAPMRLPAQVPMAAGPDPRRPLASV